MLHLPPQETETKMPSPSRIPRPKVHVSKKHGKENDQDIKSQHLPQESKPVKNHVKRALKKPEVKTFVKSVPNPTQKKSPLRVVNENKLRQNKNGNNPPPTKTTFHDRRGISEIKRSEKNLRLALELMENDADSLRHELDAIKHEVKEKDRDMDELKLSKLHLQERVQNLERENDLKAEVLEKIGCDAKTGTKITAKNASQSLLEIKSQENIPHATELFQHIIDMKASFREMQSRLNEEIF